MSSQKILHIVNDSNAAKSIVASGLPGEILPWQDALYEGPVIAANDIDKLTQYRAEYFATRGFGDYKSIEQAYKDRNASLKKHTGYSKIVLWFDHDLFGQLQLVQLVDWFSKQKAMKAELLMIDLKRLQRGLKTLRIGQLLPSDVVRIYQSASEITSQQVEICNRAWDAFCGNSPHKLMTFFPRDLSSMPFLKNAFARLVQEYPSRATGLSRTEYLIIDAVKNKMDSDDTVFTYVQAKEPVAYMSRQVFQQHLDRLLNAQFPILKKEKLPQEASVETTGSDVEDNTSSVTNDVVIRLTSQTNQVLNKWVDWIQLNGINRWIGGVHLYDGNMWRYDPVSRSLNKTYV